MIYIAFILVLFLFVLSYFLFQRNILNPSVILCSVFLVSLSFTIFNQKNWGISFADETVFIIVITILAFIAGNILSSLKRKKRIENLYFLELAPFSYKVIIVLDFLLIMLLFFYFKATYHLSLVAGNSLGYEKMLIYARLAKLNFYTISKFNNYSFFFAKSVTYINFFIFSYLKIYKKKFFSILYLLTPLPIYSGFIILSTGRTDFIYLFVYMFVVYFILYQKKLNFSKKLNKRIIMYGVMMLFVFFGIFIIVGSFRGSSSSIKIIDKISIYTGSSLAGLNDYLINGRINTNIKTYFGQNTLFKIYNILRKIGFEIPNFYAPYDFITFKNGNTTNIYSAIRRYIEDFGALGLLFVSMILGFIYGKFFEYASYRKNNFFILILYASLCYPIFEFPIEERFFMTLFPTNIIYDIIFLGVIYYIMVYKKFIRKK